MSDTIVVPLEDIKQVAEKYPGSYFAGAVSFAESCGHGHVEISSDATRYMHIADPATFTSQMDEFAIDATALSINLIRCMLEVNKDSLEIVKTYVPEMIRLRMYEEFQKYVFSQIDEKEMVELHNLHNFTIEFITAYPYRNKNNSTMLMCFIYGDLPNMCMQILKSKKNVGLEQINDVGNTALILACAWDLQDVALAILEMDNTQSGQVNNKGSTALIWTCYNYMPEAALAILATETAGKPEQVDEDGETALINACSNTMTNVALAILATDKANPKQVDKKGNSALDYAQGYYKRRYMRPVIDRLTALLS